MSGDEKVRSSGDQNRQEGNGPVLPVSNPVEAAPEAKPAFTLHPAFYIAAWISLSSSVILFNKWILHTANFHFPISLTTWHMAVATLMTQLLARFTNTLDSRHKVPMTGRVYLRAIVPIGAFFSLSLIFGNLTYLYLSVSFIQMLKATTPVAVLLATWSFGIEPPNLKTLGNVSFIVIGVVIASIGEIQFVMIGFLYQIGGLMFEAIRIAMVQRLLSSAEFKMDPLVSLYYFAPACATMNCVVALLTEIPKMTMNDVYNVGIITLIANAMVAFLLNVSVVLLIGKTSALVFTLSGVLKDIMLVMASMAIFRDPVSGLQVGGYSVALSGLVYYKLGSQKLKDLFGTLSRSWAEYGAKHPAMKKLIIFCVIATILFIILGGLAPYLPAEYRESAMQIGSSLGKPNSINA